MSLPTRISQTGFEQSSMGGLYGDNWAPISATTPPALDTTTKRSGASSLKCATSGATTDSYARVGNTTGTIYSRMYTRAWFYIPTGNLPASGQYQIMKVHDLFFVELSSTGQLRMFQSGNTGTWSTATVPLDTWFCIQTYTNSVASAGAGEWRVFLDGTEIINESGLTVSNTGSDDRVDVGLISAANNRTIYVDDVAFNGGDSVGYNAAHFPAMNGKIVNLLPASDNAGSGTNWTVGTGNSTSNRYDAVNNDPPVGVALASRTVTSQIINAAKDIASYYKANMETLASKGIGTITRAVEGVTGTMSNTGKESLIGASAGARRVAQSFVAAEDTIQEIEIATNASTGLTGTWELRADNGGVPGTLLESGSTFTTSATNRRGRFPVNLGGLTPGDTYWLVLYGNFTGTTYEWHGNNSYANGVTKVSTDSGATWPTTSSTDRDFQIFFVDSSGARVTHAQVLSIAGNSTTTTGRTMHCDFDTNPAPFVTNTPSGNVTTNTEGTANNTATAAAAHPTGWFRVGSKIYAYPDINGSVTPVTRLRKGVSSTDSTMHEYLGMMIEYIPGVVPLTDPAPADSISVSDSLVSTEVGKGVAPADTLTLADQAARDITKDGLNDTLALSDSVGRQIQITIGDSISVSDSATPAQGFLHQTSPADTLTLSDAAATEQGRQVSVGDTLTLADDANKQVQKAGLSDTLALTDSPTTAEGHDVQAGDTLTLADSARKDSNSAVSDSVGVADLATPVSGIGYTVSPGDSLSVSDAATVSEGHGVVPADTLGLADAQRSDVQATRNDTLSLADSQSSDLGLGHTVNSGDTLSLSDSAAIDISKSGLSDSAGVADQGSTQPNKIVNDSITVADVITGLQIQKAANDTITLSDSAALDISKSGLSDSVGVADSATPEFTAGQQNFELTVGDTLTVADDSSRDVQHAESDALDRNETFDSTPSDLITGTSGGGSAVAVTGGNLETHGGGPWFYITDAYTDGNFIAEWDLYWYTPSGSRDIFNAAFWIQKPGFNTANGFMFRLQTSGGDGGFYQVTNGSHFATTDTGQGDASTSMERGVEYRLRLESTGTVVRARLWRLDTSALVIDRSFDLGSYMDADHAPRGVVGQKQDGAGTSAQPTLLRRLYATAGLRDAASKQTQRLESDSAAVADSATPAAGWDRTAGDSLTLNDTAFKSPDVKPADTLAVADLLAALNINKSASDSLSLADSASSDLGLGLIANANDTLSLSDDASRDIQKAGLADSAALSDSSSAQPNKSVADSIGVSDSASGVADRFQSAADNLSVDDAATTNSGKETSASDSISVADDSRRDIHKVKGWAQVVAGMNAGGAKLGLDLIPWSGEQPFTIDLDYLIDGSALGTAIPLLGQVGGDVALGGASGGWVPAIYFGNDGKLYVSTFWHGAVINQNIETSGWFDGQPHHLTVTYDGVYQRVYRDGSLIDTQLYDQSGYASTYSYFIGAAKLGSWPASGNPPGDWAYLPNSCGVGNILFRTGVHSPASGGEGDYLSVSDAFSRDIAMLLVDIASLSDSVVTDYGIGIRLDLASSLTVSDDASSQVSKAGIIDSVPVDDLAALETAKLIADAIAVNDALLTEASAFVEVADSIDVEDDILRLLGAGVEDALELSDASRRDVVLSAADAVALLDEATTLIFDLGSIPNEYAVVVVPEDQLEVIVDESIAGVVVTEPEPLVATVGEGMATVVVDDAQATVAVPTLGKLVVVVFEVPRLVAQADDTIRAKVIVEEKPHE